MAEPFDRLGGNFFHRLRLHFRRLSSYLDLSQVDGWFLANNILRLPYPCCNLDQLMTGHIGKGSLITDCPAASHCLSQSSVAITCQSSKAYCR